MNSHASRYANNYYEKENTMTKKIDINRALRDEDYLASLSEAERALVPANPAGIVAISDDDLAGARGGLPITCPSSNYSACPDGCCG